MKFKKNYWLVAILVIIIAVGYYIVNLLWYPYTDPIELAIMKGNIRSLQKAVSSDKIQIDTHEPPYFRYVFKYLNHKYRHSLNKEQIVENAGKYYDKMYQMLKILLNNGVSVNATDMGGQAALHFAVFDIPNSTILKNTIEQRKRIVELLLNEGADIDIMDDNGDTPLHNAIYEAEFTENTVMLEYLLENGADLTIKNKNNMTPYEVAEQRGLSDCQNLLSKYM